MLHPAALLTAEDARNADTAAIASGIASETLMQNAASACVEVINALYLPCPTLVVCGHGNNGGDGKLIAALLKKQGWPVSESDTQSFTASLLTGKALIIDALFGTGLNRPIEGASKEIIAAINASGVPVVAVDIASGINATTGEVMGTAIRATHTVTFVRPKLGQWLMPGKAHSGLVHVRDIGIDGHTLTPQVFDNQPGLWKHALPVLSEASHKYTRGHAIIMGGGIRSTGAARLAAMGALRAGAGLVSVACTSEALPIYASALTSVMTKVTDSPQEREQLLSDERVTAVLIGPGYGVSNQTERDVLHILSHQKPCVIDADALTSFKHHPNNLFSVIKSPVVLTPHEGEFSRMFTLSGSKAARACMAAKQSGAVMLLKGSDTVIAAPDGRIAVNHNAPPWLATAGSGDVLAGITTGLLAQGMPAFEATCAAVWIHGSAASNLGIGMIAEDLPGTMPSVLRVLYN